ncbi:MAG: hypothetical protein EZS28_000911 [Streblomastix strix]|uniref:Uncharacterized protein n=1 Tax=Streblomastix strix TaxID=222440 RepID=A0A5J4XAN6_9EUKA|nr:MAG: hypothetical protein EZS28_000911 [Streblomastix strix]
MVAGPAMVYKLNESVMQIPYPWIVKPMPSQRIKSGNHKKSFTTQNDNSIPYGPEVQTSNDSATGQTSYYAKSVSMDQLCIPFNMQQRQNYQDKASNYYIYWKFLDKLNRNQASGKLRLWKRNLTISLQRDVAIE